MANQPSHAQNPSVVCIETTEIPIITYQHQRVITTEHLAQVYGTDINNIQANFSRNKDRFEEGRHFFKLEGRELADFKSVTSSQLRISSRAKHLILWTERGASRHAKMLDTDQAWSKFDQLEAAYFELAEGPQLAGPAEPTPKTIPYADPLTPELRAAIAQKAHELSVASYPKLVAELERAARGWITEGRSPEDVRQLITTAGSSNDYATMVPTQVLSNLVAMAQNLQSVADWGMAAIHDLEAATGREWYKRVVPAEKAPETRPGAVTLVAELLDALAGRLRGMKA